jgi:hypothetical protein
LAVLALSSVLSFASVAQTLLPDNPEWMHYLEELAGDEVADPEALADLYDELTQLVERPYNLLTVTKKELEKLPFLTALQIENLLYYLYRYGPPVDIAELKNVEDLDMQTIRRLLPFVCIAPLPPDSTDVRRPHFLRNQLVISAHTDWQTKAGYRDGSYLGSPHSGSFRYYLDDRGVQFGIAGEKDSGEKGLDYTTFNLNFKSSGLIEALHFGNYRLSFGQGLVMNTNFSIGKTADAVSLGLRSAGIQRHVSTNESQYFSGVAGVLHRGNFRLHLFYSLRNQDATVDDSTIYSFKTDGYHRTRHDLLKRATAQITLYGGHLQWQSHRWSLGLTGIRYDFGGKTLNPKLQPYNWFYLRGSSYANAGFDYEYRSKRLHMKGEMALDPSAALASVTHFNLRVASFAEGVFSFRYYDKRYNALYAKGFSESTAIRNEAGYYTGIRLLPFPKWEVSAGLDYFFFPWLRFGVDTPSSGKDLMVRLKYRFRADGLMELRYRYKEKQGDDSADASSDISLDGSPDAPLDDSLDSSFDFSTDAHHRWRYQCRYTPRPMWETALQIDFNRRPNTPARRGWSWKPSVAFLPPSGAFRIDAGLLYFHTDDWDTRITFFEKSLPYTLRFPACYGHGWRVYTVLKWRIARSFTFYLKAGSTHYFDRTSIGTGPEAISGRTQSDVYGLLQYVF